MCRVALVAGLVFSHEVREIFRFDRVLCDVCHTQDPMNQPVNFESLSHSFTFFDIL